MKYMKLYGSMAGDEHTEVARLRRRIERYRRALRRCARHRKRERDTRAMPPAPANGNSEVGDSDHPATTSKCGRTAASGFNSATNACPRCSSRRWCTSSSLRRSSRASWR